MERTTGNLLLDSLDDESRERLLGEASTHEIGAGTRFAEPGDELDEVMFPVAGTLSLLTLTNGETVESASVGREGVVGALAVLGIREMTQELIGQVEGRFVGVPPDLVLTIAKESGRLSELLNGYVAYLLSQASIGGACNAVHLTTERAARWLLNTHDRVDADTFDLKQEFLALMLGVQRPTVSISAGALQEAGFIRYRRGHITILDREGLESAACPCYELIRAAYSRFVPLR